MDDRPIFLVGFMGSGKTTFGRALAQELEWGFVDLDELIVQREGREIERIFRDEGEGHFRRVESQALISLDGRDRCVVATGGGIFLGAEPRRWMKSRGRTVWLDVPLETCRRRVGAGRGRPLWLASDAIAFRAFFEKRRAAYALASLRLDAGDASAEELVPRLLPLLGVFR